MPEGHDPDSFVKTFGPEKLKEVITKGDTFFVYLLERLSEQHDPKTDRGKLQIVQQMAEWLVRIPSPILLSSYAQQTASRLGVPEEAVRQVLRKVQLARRGAAAPTEAAAATDSAEGEDARTEGLPAEIMLLQLMLAGERAVELVGERLDREWLTGSTAGNLIGRITSMQTKGHWSGLKGLLTQVIDEEEGRLISRLAVGTQAAEGLQTAVDDCLATLERRWAKRRLGEIDKRLSEPDLPMKERDKLIHQMFDLQPKLRNIPALSMKKTRSSAS
jgi:DNA primase